MTGCGISTERILSRHWDYNEAIRKTNDEQLLLNLVRLRYGEMPYFLQVASISNSFAAQQSLGGTTTVTRDAATVFGGTGSISFTDSPIITWTLPESRAYLGRLMAPLSASQLNVLAESGWGEDRVYRIGIKKMNRLRNKEFQVIDGVFTPNTYKDLLEVFELLKALGQEGQLDLAYGYYSNKMGGNIMRDEMDPTAISEGMGNGIYFLNIESPDVFEPIRISTVLHLRLSKNADDDPRIQRLRDLLDLDPTRYTYGIIDSASAGADGMRSLKGEAVNAFDPDLKFTEILLNNRSMMEILYLASTLIEVPSDHVANHYVDPIKNGVPEWLRIKTSPKEPRNAWISVNYHGNWFYISASDIESREAFTLVNAMFASVVGSVPGSTPLLTLPVNN
jgi:hypothetical protein